MRSVGLNVSRATACRAMQRLKMRYIKKKARPFWKPRNLQSRLNFSREHMTWNKEWHKVVFQMKSVLTLMGQMDSSTIGTNWTKILSIIRKAKAVDSQSIMVWGAFAYGGLIPLQILSNSVER